MATGDVRGSLRKLQASLRSVKYPRDVDYQGLAKGDPSCCLPIVSYAFTSFSTAVAEHLVESGIELTGKNDLSFMESVYKVLRDLFSYKPLLTKQQFLQIGFAERKISLLCDIIGFVLDKHRQLTKGTKPVGPLRRRQLSRTDSKSVEGSPPRETQRTPGQRVGSRRLLVERHPGLQRSPAHVSFSSDDQQLDEDEDEEGRQRPHDQDVPRPSAHTGVCDGEPGEGGGGRAAAVCVQAGAAAEHAGRESAGAGEEHSWKDLHRAQCVGGAGEPGTAAGDGTDVNPGTGSDESGWSYECGDEPAPDETVLEWVKEPASSSTVTHRTSPASQLSSSSEENIKERLERIASMMKDTSSLLKNIEPTI